MAEQTHRRTDAPTHGAPATQAQGAGAGTMRVVVVSSERALFDGPATSVVARAYDGEVGILPHHAPFLTLLGDGLVRVRAPAEELRFRVSGGVIQVRRNVVRVVAEQATPA